jgi:hypothetical protein
MSQNVKFSFVFSLKLIYKRKHMLKEMSKSVQIYSKLSKYLKSKLYSLINLTLNKMDTYLSKCKI